MLLKACKSSCKSSYDKSEHSRKGGKEEEYSSFSFFLSILLSDPPFDDLVGPVNLIIRLVLYVFWLIRKLALFIVSS